MSYRALESAKGNTFPGFAEGILGDLALHAATPNTRWTQTPPPPIAQLCPPQAIRERTPVTTPSAHASQAAEVPNESAVIESGHRELSTLVLRRNRYDGRHRLARIVYALGR